MTRAWPVPPLGQTIHLVGDTQGINPERKAIVLADMPRMPDVAHRVQVGDFTLFGQVAQFPPVIDFMNQMGSGQWWACVGNHDVEPNNPPINPNGGGLTASQAAGHMGMPGKNFSVDLGYAVLVIIYVNTNVLWGYEEPDTGWLNTELNKYPGRTVLLIGHTQLLGANAGADMPTSDSNAWKAVIADHPNVKAWLAGHSHFAMDRVGMTNTLTIGGRQVFTVDAGALHYTVPGVDWTDELKTLYLTVLDDRLEVRCRDHAAHQWTGVNPERQRVVVFDLD